MNNIMKWFEKIAPFMMKFANLKYISIMQSAFVTTMPVLLIGSTFLLISQFPIPAVKTFLQPFNFGSVSIVTMEMFSVFLVIAAAYHTSEYNATKRGALVYNKLIPIILSVSSFILVCKPIAGDLTPAAGEVISNIFIPMSFLGTKGILSAIVVGVVTTEIFEFFIRNKIVISMPEQVPPMVAQSFASIIPFFAVMALWWSLAIGMRLDIPQMFTDVFKPFVNAGDTLGASLGITFLNRALWVVGIHGSNVVSGVAGPLMTTLATQNLEQANALIASGIEVTDPKFLLDNIATTYFYDNYVWVGFVPLSLVLMTSKNAAMKKLGFLSFIPAIFNIGEPLIFGLPIVLNPYMVVPFIFGYVGLAAVSFILVDLGLLAIPYASVMWTMPAPIKTYIATGYQIMPVLYVLLAWIFIFLIFLPFVRAFEKSEEKKLVIKKLKEKKLKEKNEQEVGS